MINSLLLIGAIIAGIYGLKKWQAVPQSERKSFGTKAVLWGGAGIVMALVVTGRAHWLMGILAALLALASRAAQFVQYVPMAKKIFGAEDPSAENTNSSASASDEMSRQGAADILGVDIAASKDEVRAAHKRLMQKIHPDRGGSEALAKQINAAKERMLS